jgi:hypothetical protein
METCSRTAKGAVPEPASRSATARAEFAVLRPGRVSRPRVAPGSKPRPSRRCRPVRIAAQRPRCDGSSGPDLSRAALPEASGRRAPAAHEVARLVPVRGGPMGAVDSGGFGQRRARSHHGATPTRSAPQCTFSPPSPLAPWRPWGFAARGEWSPWRPGREQRKGAVSEPASRRAAMRTGRHRREGRGFATARAQLGLPAQSSPAPRVSTLPVEREPRRKPRGSAHHRPAAARPPKNASLRALPPRGKALRRSQPPDRELTPQNGEWQAGLGPHACGAGVCFRPPK